jgi:hypothetical protein
MGYSGQHTEPTLILRTYEWNVLMARTQGIDVVGENRPVHPNKFVSVSPTGMSADAAWLSV